ncbi:Ribonuclease H-like domain containing protein [Trema orientale]|uniref:Ribonuclease H-like domain containing protein n=1 Tax=Trema orientale TaxID=63057 RepID=A0A2P5D898_TREOI|nr:Ribonuclease H-like domain containing protein [Trema orientale]
MTHLIAPTPSLFGQQMQKWQASALDCIKLNVDAAIDRARNSFGIGAVARNSNCEVIAGMSKEILGTFSPKLAEIKALGIGLSWIHELGIFPEAVETDALAVTQSLSHPLDFDCDFGNLLLDVSHLLSYFPGTVFKHISCSANGVAHALAKHANECTWLGKISPPIMIVVVLDNSN